MSISSPVIYMCGEGASDIASSKDIADLKNLVFHTIYTAVNDKCTQNIAEGVQCFWTEDSFRQWCKNIYKANLKSSTSKVIPIHAGIKYPDNKINYISNLAFLFAVRCLDGNADLGIFFHDCDFSDCKELYQAVKKAFTLSKYKGAVAMLPNPTSESWVLLALEKVRNKCSVHDENSGRIFEKKLKPNDKNIASAKAKLAQFVSGNPNVKGLEAGEYQHIIQEIDSYSWENLGVIFYLPSARLFKESCEDAVRSLKW